MPPSGFSQKAINGLLTFVQATYEDSVERYERSGLPERASLEKDIQDLERKVRDTTTQLMPISPEGVQGLVDFVTTNYRDLIAEIDCGKKRPNYAMRAEIDDIGRYLEKFNITHQDTYTPAVSK